MARKTAKTTEAGEHAKILADTAASLRRQAADLTKESQRLRKVALKLREKRNRKESKPPARSSQ